MVARYVREAADEQWTEYAPVECLDNGEGPECAFDVLHRRPDGTLVSRERHWYWGNPIKSFEQESCDYPGWRDGRESLAEVYGAEGQLLRTVRSVWSQRAGVAWWEGNDALREPPKDVRLVRTVSVLDDGQRSRVRYERDDYGNVTRQEEYGFDGALARWTETTYVAGGEVEAAHIRNLPRRVRVGDAGGVRSETSYRYDETDPAPTPGLVGWLAPAGREATPPAPSAGSTARAPARRPRPCVDPDVRPGRQRACRSGTSSTARPGSDTTTTSARPTASSGPAPAAGPSRFPTAVTNASRPRRRSRSTTTTSARPWTGATRTASSRRSSTARIPSTG